MNAEVVRVFRARGFGTVDAEGSTGSKDYLERILNLIRGTGFTVAIFSHETRGNSLANIALELGFAAMCGKPLLIVKTQEASAPSDLKRTDWIEYEHRRPRQFRHKLDQALDEIERLSSYESNLLQALLEARSPDCAVGLERANKGFLLSVDERFVVDAERMLSMLNRATEGDTVADLERLRSETRMFIREAKASLQATLKKSID